MLYGCVVVIYIVWNARDIDKFLRSTKGLGLIRNLPSSLFEWIAGKERMDRMFKGSKEGWFKGWMDGWMDGWKER
jgi:hypothetical protein